MKTLKDSFAPTHCCSCCLAGIWKITKNVISDQNQIRSSDLKYDLDQIILREKMTVWEPILFHAYLHNQLRIGQLGHVTSKDVLVCEKVPLLVLNCAELY